MKRIRHIVVAVNEITFHLDQNKNMVVPIFKIMFCLTLALIELKGTAGPCWRYVNLVYI